MFKYNVLIYTTADGTLMVDFRYFPLDKKEVIISDKYDNVTPAQIKNWIFNGSRV